MVLLGDLGGLFGSLMLIGTGLHFLIVGNTLPIQLLKHYFTVDGIDHDNPKDKSQQRVHDLGSNDKELKRL